VAPLIGLVLSLFAAGGGMIAAIVIAMPLASTACG